MEPATHSAYFITLFCFKCLLQQQQQPNNIIKEHEHRATTDYYMIGSERV